MCNNGLGLIAISYYKLGNSKPDVVIIDALGYIHEGIVGVADLVLALRPCDCLSLPKSQEAQGDTVP